MLRGNLSTRPFYNDRLVTAIIAGLALIVLAATAFNVTRIVSLARERSAVRADIDAELAEAARIRGEVDAIQASVDRPTLTRLTGATQEANRLIDQRTFSWTNLFSLLERTLPPDVRLTSISHRVDTGTFRVAMAVVARDLDSIDVFIDALTATGRFYDVAPTEQRLQDDGGYAAIVQASYLTTAPAPAVAPAGGGAR
jgi:Tfp pilus assembly protein PilN